MRVGALSQGSNDFYQSCGTRARAEFLENNCVRLSFLFRVRTPGKMNRSSVVFHEKNVIINNSAGGGCTIYGCSTSARSHVDLNYNSVTLHTTSRDIDTFSADSAISTRIPHAAAVFAVRKRNE